MNRNYIPLIVLLLLTISVGGYVYKKSIDKEEAVLVAVDLIPENFTSQVIEISSPVLNLEEVYNANLIWKEIKEESLLKKIEKFWNNKDSVFNEIKGKAKKLIYFQDQNKKDYFILEFENDLLDFNLKDWKSKKTEQFSLFTKEGSLEAFSKSLNHSNSIKNEKGFNSAYNSIANKNEKINIYRKKQEEWSVFELLFLPEQIFTNGFENNKGAKKKLNSNVNVSVLSKIPRDFKNIKIIHFDSIHELKKDSVVIKAKGKNCNCEVEFEAYNWIESPAVKFQTQFHNASYAMFKLKSIYAYKESMYALLNDTLLNLEEDNERVIRFDSNFNYNSLFGSTMNYNYLMRINDYLFFGENKIDLERISFQINSNQTIDKSNELHDFLIENINAKSFEINITGGVHYWDFDLNSGVGIVQSHVENEKLLYSSMLYTKEINLNGGKTNPKWITKFDTTLLPSIFVVNNHRTNDKDYLVQDVNNVLYFVSPNGEMKWKRTLDNSIIGKIKNIDILGNNKFQLIFNTKSKLYILDVLGRDVTHFPVKVLDEATANVSVMDYDKDLNFRFLIPTKKGIKSIDKFGNIVKGWKQPQQSSIVKSNITHLLIANLDYILVQDKAGRLYFYNRKGEVRHTINSKFTNELEVISGSSIETTRAIFLDSNTNSINRQFFDDKQNRVLLKPEKKILGFYYFDFNADKKKDFILVFEDEIKIYDPDLSIQKRIEIPKNIHLVKFWKNGYGFINQFNELTINQNNESKIVDEALDYRIDTYKNKTRIVVKGENNVKLLHF